ncbi:MAG: tRNA guanosine(34) transglycosylase Tgt [Phycisphaerales bacterium]|jgi:queuine tRNA-ribosyltransferase|nr:tRNA guanosine(34) transglycosylase Tgt [Phycisphaerales bacterium]
MPAPVRYERLATDPHSRARLGRVATPHGVFDTPAFMPVGTRASVKGILPGLVRASGAQILLNNTYHLMLRPGERLIEKMGGVHRFMGWDGPILTDSGGFQAFSMADLNAIDEDGVTFKSIVDGSPVRLTPERAIEVQNALGPDIIMAFDDCPPARDEAHDDASGAEANVAGVASAGVEGDVPRAVLASRRARDRDRVDYERRLDESNARTVRWLERCVQAHARPNDQALFGIVQGGTDLARRERSARDVTAIDLPGYAIGGVAVGEDFADIARVVRSTAPLLPEDRPRYLMGVGYPRDIVAAVRAGVDMFDCVLPTRNGRNAAAFVPEGVLKLRNARHAEDPGPIEEGCDCPACGRGGAGDAPAGWVPGYVPGGALCGGHFSRAYLRHLFMAGEMLGPILVSLHNLRFYQRLMGDLRRVIRSGEWEAFASRWPCTRAAFEVEQ